MKAESFRTCCDWPFTPSTPADWVDMAEILGLDDVQEQEPAEADLEFCPGEWDFEEVDEAQAVLPQWQQ